MANRLYIHFHKESDFGKLSAKGLHLKNPEQRDLDNALEQIAKDGWEDVHLYKDAWADLRAWKEPDSYMGAQYYGYVGLCGSSRDSDVLERANWSAITDEAKAQVWAKEEACLDEESMPYLEIASASHWACGWVETAMVYWARVDALDYVAMVRRALEDYAVYDDSAYSEIESEEQEKTFRNYKREFMTAVAAFILGREERGLDLEDEFSKDELKHLEDVAWRLYTYDCSYGGIEDSFVHLKDVEQHTKDVAYDLSFMARNGNTVARRLLRRAGVKMTPKAKMGVL
jgi:hypothetical protein